MKNQLFNSLLLVAALVILSGCVSRTVSTEPEIRGATPNKKSYGTNDHSTIHSKKIIWIWQDEFRNPK